LSDTIVETAGRPVRPRDAASLVLVRHEADGPRILMGRRTKRHAFAPDVFVFPGGRLDPGDARMAPATPLKPEVLAKLARRRAEALALAAVRETFEETGLVIGRPVTAPVPTPNVAWAAFVATGYAPSLAEIDYVARAITPPDSPIRFHARFFMADADHAAGSLGGSGELVDLAWFSVDEALRLPVMDVTEYVLGRVAGLVAGETTEPTLFSYRNGRAVSRPSLATRSRR
jgi:8-oxo-dGTP pyrophosphatase MutT (NUDIX family)